MLISILVARIQTVTLGSNFTLRILAAILVNKDVSKNETHFPLLDELVISTTTEESYPLTRLHPSLNRD